MSGVSSPGWRAQAACVGKPVEWFFPDRAGSHSYERGKQVCAACPVVPDCRAEHARASRQLGRDLPGLWGGEVQGREARMALRRATPVVCAWCGESFTDRVPTRPKYCSMACSQAVRQSERNDGRPQVVHRSSHVAALPIHKAGEGESHRRSSSDEVVPAPVGADPGPGRTPFRLPSAEEGSTVDDHTSREVCA